MSAGSYGVWAQKSGDFHAREFDGTPAGVAAAIAYCGSNGIVSIFPGNAGLSVPTPGSGVQIHVHEGSRITRYSPSTANFTGAVRDTVVNVKDFDSFQAAHDALPSTGGTIYVPAGAYTHGTKPSWGSGSAAGMVVTKDTIVIQGEGSNLTSLRNFASGAENQHGFDLRCNALQIKHLAIDGVDADGTGNHIFWHKAGSSAVQCTLEDVTITRAPFWGFRATADYGQFMGKILMTRVEFDNENRGGDMFIGSSGVPTDNCRFYGCEFSGGAVGGYHEIYPVTVATSSPHLSATDLTSIANGDEVFGTNIPNGAKVTNLNTSGGTDTADLTIAPTSGGSNRVLCFLRYGSVGGSQVPLGSAHLYRMANARLHGCSFQGPTNVAGLSLVECAHIDVGPVYREYASPFTGPVPFITTAGQNLRIDVGPLVMQTNTGDPKLFQSASLGVGAGGALQQVRFHDGTILTNQNPPTLANVVVLGDAADDFELERVTSFSTATGTRYSLILSGNGAGFVAVASVAGTMTLPNPASDTFSLTGTNAVTSITAQHRGRRVTLIATSTASLTNGNNLKLNGNWTGAADKSISLISDGTNWIETGRS